MIEAKWIEEITAELSAEAQPVTAAHVAAAIQLIESGATIPFIARYRKDTVGGLDEAQLETVAERNSYFIGLMNRRKTVLEAAAKQDKLTDALRERIESCADRVVLEDLYLPFKAKRHTKAAVAEEQGLAPLADFIMKQLPGLQSIEEFAEAFAKPGSVSSAEEAFEGARNILAERFTMDPDARADMRRFMISDGVLSSRATKNADGAKAKYQPYYKFSEPLAKISPPRLLTILRGEKEGILRVDITIDDVKMFNILLDRFLTQPDSVFGAHIRLALNEAYARHLRPAIEKEAIEIIRKRAEEDAIRLCRDNAQHVLLAPPAGRINVIGVAPARGGSTIAVVDASGAFVEQQTITLHGAQEDPQGVERALLDLIEKHGAFAFAVGNGSGAREIARFINGVLLKVRTLRPSEAFVVLMNAGPAAAFASCGAGRDEFPDLPEPAREAVSLARRLQDPLAELVKVEPRQMGIGQHQYDVNQKQLREALYKTVATCVNRVGLDLNTAPVGLLRYISGFQMGTAQNLVAKRQERGGFTARTDLTEVDGVGPKVYEQCVGFLRIPNAAHPLDATRIHPEAYPVVERMAQAFNVSIAELVGNSELLSDMDLAVFEGDGVGPLTLADIRAELLHPGEDPRGPFRAARFRDGAATIQSLQEGAEIEGVVTNVADFGAFVDIGAQQDGLVHLSELSARFVKDPHKVVKIGDVVKVKIIKIDKETPRISLSIKALQVRPRRPAPQRPRTETHPQGARTAAPAAAPAPDGAESAPTEERPRRPASRRRAPAQTQESEQPRGRRPDRGDRSRDRDRPREARPDGEAAGRRSQRPPRRPTGDRDSGKTPNFGDTGKFLNTQLAEQLAALKGKLGS